HFTPTSSSWLNQIERWFAEITRKRIRRGTFRSVGDLIKAIQDYIQRYNRNPQPFRWVASARKIIRKVNKYKDTLETAHSLLLVFHCFGHDRIEQLRRGTEAAIDCGMRRPECASNINLVSLHST